jgi:hypothetical protein
MFDLRLIRRPYLGPMMRAPPGESEMAQEPSESKLEREVESEEAGQKAGTPLLTLIPNDRDLFEAMEFFLLASPSRQVQQLGDWPSLKKVAEEAKSSGNTLFARINYESAAKIALYEQNKEEFRSLLTLAEEVTTSGERFGEFHRILLDKTDQALQIAREYYASFS